MFLIPLDSLSILLVVMAASVLEMMNCFGVLDPLIKNFIKVALVIGPLSLVGVVFILRKIEKDHLERTRWQYQEKKMNSTLIRIIQITFG